MNIRNIDNHELQSLLNLYADLHQDEMPSSIENARVSWDEIQDNPRIKVFGAFLNEELVSSCMLTIIPNLTRGCRPYGLIENVVTLKSHQRQGIGKTILRHTLDFAWSEGCYKVMLMSGRLDEKTFAFYESVGFDHQLKKAFIAKPE